MRCIACAPPICPPSPLTHQARCKPSSWTWHRNSLAQAAERSLSCRQGDCAWIRDRDSAGGVEALLHGVKDAVHGNLVGRKCEWTGSRCNQGTWNVKQGMRSGGGRRARTRRCSDGWRCGCAGCWPTWWCPCCAPTSTAPSPRPTASRSSTTGECRCAANPRPGAMASLRVSRPFLSCHAVQVSPSVHLVVTMLRATMQVM